MAKSFQCFGIACLAGCFLVLALFSAGAAQEICGRYQAVTVGGYVIQTDYWNQSKCPGTQCVSVDGETGAFTVDQGTYNCGYNVAAYPNIHYGCAWGGCSPNSDLPARLDSLQCVTTSWTFVPTYTGAWDAAYDIWFCPDNQCGPGGFPGGLELMIWLDYWNTNGWKNDLGIVDIDGMTWKVWTMDVSPSRKCQYLAYLAETKTDSVTDLDLKGFFEDAQGRGFLKPSWYLYAVEAGNEFHSDGIPFTSKSFSVSVNKGCGAKAVLPALPTSTPALK